MQGVEPPSPRGEEWCDAATKTHINDNPAYYYNYAFATVFKFQLHDYIARKILHQPPQSCNYADNKEVGTWLNNILKKGGTEDWRKVLKEATGEDISTRAMMEYFKPLMSWLEEQHKGCQMGGSSREQRVKDCAFQSNGHPSGLLFFLAGMVMRDLYARTTSTDRWPYSIPAK